MIEQKISVLNTSMRRSGCSGIWPPTSTATAVAAYPSQARQEIRTL